MSRITVIVFLLLASFGVFAGEHVNAFDALHAKIDCITAHGGMHSKRVSICFQTDTKTASKALVEKQVPKKSSNTVPLVKANANAFDTLNAKIDCIAAHGGMYSKKAAVCFQSKSNETTKVVPVAKEWPYRNVGGDSFKNALKKALKKAHSQKEKEMVVGRMTHTAVYSLPGMTIENKRLLFPVMHSHVRFLTGLSQDDSVWQKQPKAFNVYEKGEKFTGMVFGDGSKTKSDVISAVRPYRSQFTGKMTETIPSFDILMPDGTKVPFLVECWNLASQEFIPPKLEKATPLIKPRSVSPNVEENVSLVKLTLGGWAGAHTSSGWKGHFDGFKATVTLPAHVYLGLENEQVWVGVGVRGERWSGRSRINQYKGKGSRLVPAMLVVDWNGRGGLIGDTHAGSFNAGVGWNWMHGKNSATGYYKDQSGKEVHVRLEECERSGDWVMCLYAEGNGAFGKIRMRSSWSGDTPNKTSSLMVGASVEYLITDHWSAKGILEGSINDNNPRSKLAVTAAAELCYRNHWDGGNDFAVACAGPYIRLGEYDGYTFGGTGNVFIGSIISEHVAAAKAGAVSFPQPASPFIQSSFDRGQKEIK